MIEPDLDIEHQDRAQLASVFAMEGYKVIHRIMRAEVDKFVVGLINADAGNDKEVLAKHRLAKAAAQFYQAVTNRINEEVMLYTQAPRASDKPRDITEGVIDMGEITEQFADVPNLFGGEELV